MRFFPQETGATDAYYEPNSFGGAKEDKRFAEPPLKISGDADRYNHRDGNDDYKQAGDLFRLMPADAQGRLMDNIVEAMGGVPAEIVERQIAPLLPRPIRPTGAASRSAPASTSPPRRRSRRGAGRQSIGARRKARRRRRQHPRHPQSRRTAWHPHDGSGEQTVKSAAMTMTEQPVVTSVSSSPRRGSMRSTPLLAAHGVDASRIITIFELPASRSPTGMPPATASSTASR